jgi:hypothetical protein
MAMSQNRVRQLAWGLALFFVAEILLFALR